jgi:hypothetical protein
MAKQKPRMGATVFMRVPQAMFGMYLARLEHEADIFIVERVYDSPNDRWTLVLRSDRFPCSWEGRQIHAKQQKNDPGLGLITASV